MRIYLACTIRGNRGALDAARALSEFLQRSGHHVLTTHLLGDDADVAERALTEQQVYDRDLRWLESADLLIAEGSGSSYGVGFEVGYVLGRSAETGQRVLLVFDEARRPFISRMVPGVNHPACAVRAYRDPAELLDLVEAYLRSSTPDLTAPRQAAAVSRSLTRRRKGGPTHV
jgi:nucleoside 2-deoxyribosyltransferase